MPEHIAGSVPSLPPPAHIGGGTETDVLQLLWRHATDPRSMGEVLRVQVGQLGY